MPFICVRRVQFVDTDASGRIHYTAMLRHFEAAESEFFHTYGLSYADMHATGLGWPRVHVECTYTGPVRYDDVLEIEVSVDRVGNSSFTLAFAATVDARPAAHGKLTIVCLDISSQRSRPLPEEFADRLRHLDK